MTAQTKAGILMSVTLLMAVGFFLMLRKALYIPCTILAIVWLCHLRLLPLRRMRGADLSKKRQSLRNAPAALPLFFSLQRFAI